MKDAAQLALCHLCGNATLDPVPGYESFSQVTSDCKPWPGGNKLCVCRSCGGIQKSIDQRWRVDADAIYKNYAIYHQSGGEEQAVFSRDSGQPSYRSSRLADFMLSRVSIPPVGSILDIGCGNGGLLRSFHRLAPGWSLAGTEYDNKYKDEVEQIAAGTTLYTGPLHGIARTFDLVSMLHVLEHILNPADYLWQIKNKLNPGGFLVIEVPDSLQNPFDLLIADHCTHFSLPVLTGLLESSGFEIIASTREWIPKEISIVAHTSSSQERPKVSFHDHILDPGVTVTRCLSWLNAFRQAARTASSCANFGIFGTAIAGTWLFNELQEAVHFFVDEDPHRIGKQYMGRPVYSPQNIPINSHVFMAFPPTLASDIVHRLGSLKSTFHLPPLLNI